MKETAATATDVLIAMSYVHNFYSCLDHKIVYAENIKFKLNICKSG